MSSVGGNFCFHLRINDCTAFSGGNFLDGQKRTVLKRKEIMIFNHRLFVCKSKWAGVSNSSYVWLALPRKRERHPLHKMSICPIWIFLQKKVKNTPYFQRNSFIFFPQRPSPKFAQEKWMQQRQCLVACGWESLGNEVLNFNTYIWVCVLLVTRHSVRNSKATMGQSFPWTSSQVKKRKKMNVRFLSAVLVSFESFETLKHDFFYFALPSSLVIMWETTFQAAARFTHIPK